MNTTAAIIDIRGAVRRYGSPPGRSASAARSRGTRPGADRRGFEAVRGVDLKVAVGEAFALLGTNGAGKTSLIELMEGLAAPSAGTVAVLGHDPFRSRDEVRPHTGIMLQEAGFPADLTVGEMAELWHRTLSNPRPTREALAEVGLTERRETKVEALSGGERRMLDLALALMGRPHLLFLDEPTTGLDPENRRAAWRLIESHREAGTTIVLTTHYLEEAEYLAERIAIMHEGRIAAAGTIEQIVTGLPARIVVRLPHSAPPLPADLAQAASVERDTTVIECTDLQLTLGRLLQWAADGGVRLDALDARTASLDQAFHAIAGERAA